MMENMPVKYVLKCEKQRRVHIRLKIFSNLLWVLYGELQFYDYSSIAHGEYTWLKNFTFQKSLSAVLSNVNVTALFAKSK